MWAVTRWPCSQLLATPHAAGPRSQEMEKLARISDKLSLAEIPDATWMPSACQQIVVVVTHYTISPPLTQFGILPVLLETSV